MTSYKDYRLDQLYISSQDEADELERALNIRFDQFTHVDRKVWVQQNAYLDAYARTGAASHAADAADVTVHTAQEWDRLDMLGFRRRHEIAELRFSDDLQVLALERVREPNAPASLLIALLRAHLPEKYSAAGHVCDNPDYPNPGDTLFQYRQNATQQKTAGGLSLEDIAAGVYHPPLNSSSHPNPSVRPEPVEGPKPDTQSTHNRHSRERGNPQFPSAVNPPTPDDDYFPRPDDDIQPVDPDEVAYFNPSPSVRPEPVEGPKPDTQSTHNRHSRERGNPQSPSAPSAPSAVNPSPNPPIRPIATLFQKRRRPQHDDDPNTFKTKRFH